MTTADDSRAAGNALGQELSLRVVLFHEAVAAHLGLNATEHKILSLIARSPGTSPGELAAHTGLSNPAITKVVHRLTGLGHVERRRDAADGRRYSLHVAPGRRRDLARLFSPMAEAMNALVEEMDAAERAAVTRWVGSTIDILRRSTEELTRARQASGEAGGTAE